MVPKLKCTWKCLDRVSAIFFPIKTSYGFLLSEKCGAPRAINNRRGSDRFEIFFKKTFGRPLVDEITTAYTRRRRVSPQPKRVLWRCSCLPCVPVSFALFEFDFDRRGNRASIAVLTIVILVAKYDNVKARVGCYDNYSFPTLFGFSPFFYQTPAAARAIDKTNTAGGYYDSRSLVCDTRSRIVLMILYKLFSYIIILLFICVWKTLTV